MLSILFNAEPLINYGDRCNRGGSGKGTTTLSNSSHRQAKRSLQQFQNQIAVWKEWHWTARVIRSHLRVVNFTVGKGGCKQVAGIKRASASLNWVRWSRSAHLSWDHKGMPRVVPRRKPNANSALWLVWTTAFDAATRPDSSVYARVRVVAPAPKLSQKVYLKASIRLSFSTGFINSSFTTSPPTFVSRMSKPPNVFESCR